jgi:DNA mismatch endonuclease, patch repair protein
MVDTVDAATRSRMMAGIGSRNTKPELLVRRHLHARGFRYTLGGAGLPGRPDIVLPKWKVAVFVNGCFWHWHGCHLSKIPNANCTFWETKLMANQTRDDVSQMAIVSTGWRVAIVWECALRGSFAESQLPRLIRNLERWIRTKPKSKVLELPSSTTPRVLHKTK